MIATVYGRFHYVLDSLAGAALAIAVVVAYRYLSPRLEYDRPSDAPRFVYRKG
jgi:membrane-associated phospholipid phosphatase